MRKERRELKGEGGYGSHVGWYGHEREREGGVIGEGRKRDKRGEKKE